MSADTTQVQVKLAWADYQPVAKPGEADAERSELGSEHPPEERAGRGLWRRVPRHAEHAVTLADGTQTLRGLPGFEQAEIETLLAQRETLGEDKPDGDFYARTHPIGPLPDNAKDTIDRLVLVHRLREVSAQVGFTRFEASLPDINGELDLDIESVREHPSQAPGRDTVGGADPRVRQTRSAPRLAR